MIDLSKQQPFAIGGRRECYIHPEFPDRCLKVTREEFSPAKLRKQSGFLRSLRKSEGDFNENVSDFRTLRKLEKSGDPDIWNHLPKCFGWDPTTRGNALSVELFRDYDGLISRSLLDQLTRHGMDDRLQSAISKFCDFWKSRTIASRDLGLHNIVVNKPSHDHYSLKLIDGFGSTQSPFLPRIYPAATRRRSVRKADRLQGEIKALLACPDAASKTIDRGVLLRRS